MGIKRKAPNPPKIKEEAGPEAIVPVEMHEQVSAEEIAIKVLKYGDRTHLNPEEAEILAKEYLIYRLCDARSNLEAKVREF